MTEKPEKTEKPAEESVFDQAEISEELPSGEDMSPDEVEEQEKEWEATVVSESPKARLERVGEKKEADGRTLTIKEVGFTKPRMKDQNGGRIIPKKTLQGDKEYYPGKLKVKFEEDNLVEYYPNFHYFINDNGKVSNLAKINRGGDNAVSKIFRLAIKVMGQPEEEISDQDFYNWLVGKKTKMKTAKGKYLGKAWFRNDIVEFV